MKSWPHHIRTKSALLVACTAALLLFVTCGPAVQWYLCSSQARDAAQQEQPARASSEDDHQEQGANLTQVSAVNEAVIPVYKFQIAFCYSFVRIFSFEEKIITNEVFSFPLPQSHYFRTLFRRIISPNAP